MKLTQPLKHWQYFTEIERNGAYWQIVCACVSVNLRLILMRFTRMRVRTHTHTHTHINFYSLVQCSFYYFQDRLSAKHGKDWSATIGNILLSLCCCMIMWTSGVISVGSEDLLKIAVCCNIALSGLLEIHKLFFYPERGGNRFLWHVDKMTVRLHGVSSHITIMRTSNLM
jgi:hypothetical protein